MRIRSVLVALGYAVGFHMIFLLPFNLIAGGLGYGDLHPNGISHFGAKGCERYWRIAGAFAAICFLGVIAAVRVGRAALRDKR